MLQASSNNNLDKSGSRNLSSTSGMFSASNRSNNTLGSSTRHQQLAQSSRGGKNVLNDDRKRHELNPALLMGTSVFGKNKVDTQKEIKMKIPTTTSGAHASSARASSSRIGDASINQPHAPSSSARNNNSNTLASSSTIKRAGTASAAARSRQKEIDKLTADQLIRMRAARRKLVPQDLVAEKYIPTMSMRNARMLQFPNFSSLNSIDKKAEQRDVKDPRHRKLERDWINCTFPKRDPMTLRSLDITDLMLLPHPTRSSYQEQHGKDNNNSNNARSPSSSSRKKFMGSSGAARAVRNLNEQLKEESGGENHHGAAKNDLLVLEFDDQFGTKQQRRQMQRDRERMMACLPGTTQSSRISKARAIARKKNRTFNSDSDYSSSNSSSSTGSDSDSYSSTQHPSDDDDENDDLNKSSTARSNKRKKQQKHSSKLSASKDSSRSCLEETFTSVQRRRDALKTSRNRNKEDQERLKMTAYEQSISRLEKMRFAFCNDFLGGPVGVDHKDKMSLTVDLGTMTMTAENNNHHHRQARASLFTLHFVPKYHAFHIEFNSVFGVGTHRRNYTTRTTSPTQQQRRRSPSPPQNQQQRQRHRQSLVTSSVSSSRPQTVNCNNSNSLGMTNAMLTAVSTSGTFYNNSTSNKCSPTSPSSSKNIQNNNKQQEKQQQQQRLVWTIEDDVQEQEEEQNKNSNEQQQQLHSPTPPQSSSSKPVAHSRGRRFSSPIAHSMSIRRDLVREKKNLSDSAMNFNSARSKIVNKRIVLRPVVEMNDDDDDDNDDDEEKEQAFLRQLFVLQPLYGGIPLGSDHAASAALLGVDKMTLSRSQRYEITPFLTSTAVVEVSIQQKNTTKNKNVKDQQEDEEKSKSDNDHKNKNKKQSPPGTAGSSSSPRSRSRSRSPLQNNTSIQQQQQQGAAVVSLYLRARREVPTSHSIFAVTRDVRCIRTEQFQNIPRIGYHLDDDKKKREKMMKKHEDESKQDDKNSNDEDEDDEKKNHQQQIQEEQKEKDDALARLEQQQQQMKRFKKERKRLQKHEAEERNVLDFEHEATSFSLLMTAFANERHEILEREMLKNENQARIEDVADESVLRAQMKKLERVQHSNLTNNNENNTRGNSDENTNNTTPQQHPIFPSSSNNVDQQATPNASPNKNNQNNSAATSEATSALQLQNSFASVGGFGERLPSLVLSEQDVSQMSPEQRSLWTKRQLEISTYQQQLQQQQSGDQSSQNQNQNQQQQQQQQPLSLQQSTSGGSYTLRESPQHDDAEY